jgi:hypothetical protein
MRFRPANTRVINRRDDRLGRHPRCFPLVREKPRGTIVPGRAGFSILEQELQRELNDSWIGGGTGSLAIFWVVNRQLGQAERVLVEQIEKF